MLGVQRHRRLAIVVAGLLSAALIYCDGAITPAIFVLSALEGLDIAAPAVQLYVVPAAVAILAALLLAQPPYTSRISTAVGAIMLVWFVVIGAFGLWGDRARPWVLFAIIPYYGLH